MASPNEASDLLAAVAASAGSAGVFSDFDGTLAAIVDDPAAARPLAGAVDVLARLARRFRRVAVISGRPGTFLDRHLGRRGLTLRGLYGLEIVDPEGSVQSVADADRWRAIVDDVATRAEAELPPEVGVERKGLSIAVHFRQHPDREDVARRWAEAAAAGRGLLLHPARMSFELRPPIPHGKGMAVHDLADGLTHVVFLGDDVGDLEAFDALDRLAGSGSTALRVTTVRVATVKVAVASNEASPELLRRADVVVDGPEGALDLLRELADRAELARPGLAENDQSRREDRAEPD